MTVVAAATNGHIAAIALDAVTSVGPLAVESATKQIRVADVVNRKGTPRGQIAVAACGRVTLTNWIHLWEPPPRIGHDDPTTYMGSVVDSFRPLLDGHAGRGSLDSDGDLEGDFIVAYAGHIYLLSCDLGLTEPTCGYFATGSGGQVAIGAMTVLDTDDPAERVTRAVEACITHVDGIRGPIRLAIV